MGGKSHKTAHTREEPDDEEEEPASPGSVRRKMHKVTKEPDPWDINKYLKDERTAEIERNLGVE